MISFVCPACNKQLKVKDELAGKKGKCPGCGKPIMVPENRATALSEPGKRSPVAGAATEGERTLAPSAPAAAAAARGCPGTAARPARSPVSKDSQWWIEQSCRRPPSGADRLPGAAAEHPTRSAGWAPTEYWQCSATAAWAWSFARRTLHLERLVALKAMLPALASSTANRDALPPRGQGGGSRQARSRRQHLSGRRGSRRALPGHGVPRRRAARRAPEAWAEADGGRDRAHRPGDGPGAGGGAQARLDPPRHQAGQPLAGRRAGSVSDRRAASRSSTLAWRGR